MKYTYATGDRPLDGFRIEAPLGRGGFGEVYRAVSDGGKEVALKHVQANLEVELRGVGLCLNLKHPNLLALYDVRQTPGEDWWVVMEYVAGESLDKALARHPQGMPFELAMDWLKGICGAVGYLHDNGLVHRDLKPANVFFDGGIVKVGDYGLSKFITTSRRSGHTGSIGTVHYMAPEVSQGRYGKEIDLYSIGVILYELLTGKVPFDGETAGEILMKHLTAAPDLTPLPANVRPVVARLLEKDPAQRYHHARDVLKDLGIELAEVPTPSQWRGEVHEPPVVLAAPIESPRRHVPTVLPVHETRFTLSWWLRIVLTLLLTSGVVPMICGILAGLFRMRGETVALFGVGGGFITAGLLLVALRYLAYKHGLDQPRWLTWSRPIPLAARLEWLLVSAFLGLGCGMWMGGLIEATFRRREEAAALMGVGLGLLVMIATLLLQGIEAGRQRRTRGNLASTTSRPLHGMVKLGMAVVVAVGAALFLGGLVTLMTRSEELAVTMACLLGAVVLTAMLLRNGMHRLGVIAFAASCAGLTGALAGVAFDGVTGDEDSAVAFGIGVGILVLAAATVAGVWWNFGRDRAWSALPATVRARCSGFFMGHTTPWSPNSGR